MVHPWTLINICPHISSIVQSGQGATTAPPGRVGMDVTTEERQAYPEALVREIDLAGWRGYKVAVGRRVIQTPLCIFYFLWTVTDEICWAASG